MREREILNGSSHSASPLGTIIKAVEGIAERDRIGKGAL